MKKHGFPVPRVTGKIIEVVKHTPREWLQSHAVEQNVAVPVPSMMEEILEAVKRIPQEHVQNCTGEHAVDLPVRVIKTNLAEKYLEMFAEIEEQKG